MVKIITTVKILILISLVGNNTFAGDCSSIIISTLGKPSEYIRSVFEEHYFKGPGPGFEEAAKVYEAYLPYAKMGDWLPVEENIYTYTELYFLPRFSENLLHGKDFEKFKSLKDEWLSGKTSFNEALRATEDLNSRFSNRADVLTFLASLYEYSGVEEKALELYWAAHLACPYYNRAHWGLEILRSQIHTRASADYQEKKKAYEEVVKDLKTPPEIKDVVLNWERLRAHEKEALLYAIRDWLPQMKFLKEAGAKVYLKRSFELISDREEFKAARDARLKYENDFRLIDDLKGYGGAVTIFDINATLQEPYAPQGTPAHEVAHQFYAAIEKIPGGEKVITRIKELYESAKKRGHFFTMYAAKSHEEYFAESFGAKGYDLKKLTHDDPDLNELKSQILEGDLEKLTNASSLHPK